MRWPLLATALVFFAAALSWLARDPELQRLGYGKGSSLSTGPGGLSLARAWLAEHERAPVSTLARPLSRAELPEGAVLVRVQPLSFAITRGAVVEDDAHDAGPDGGIAAADGGAAQTISMADGGTSPDAGAADAEGDRRKAREEARKARAEAEQRAALLTPDEERHVSRGGRLVLALDAPYGPLGVSPADDDEPLRKVFPALPGVQELRPKSARALDGPGLVDAVSVFARGDAPVVVRRALGRGEVWLLAQPELLSNEHIGEADHLRLWASLAGGGRPVVFDELAHGLRDDLRAFELLRRWGLGPACALLMLAGLAWFWRRAVPVGAPAPFRDLRSESVDLAEAVGALYQRALLPRDTLVLHHARLVHEAQLRLGLREPAAQERVRALLDGWHPPAEGARIGDAEFRHHLEALNRAFRSLRDGHRRKS
jgi:hypothetical protein